MVLLSSLSSRDCARKFCQILPQWLNLPIMWRSLVGVLRLTSQWAGYVGRNVNNNLITVECIPNSITPFIPEIYYKVRTIYGRDWRSLNTVLNSYKTLFGTLVRWYVGLSRTNVLAYLHTKLNHVTCLALVPWFDLFHLVDQFLQVLP